MQGEQRASWADRELFFIGFDTLRKIGFIKDDAKAKMDSRASEAVRGKCRDFIAGESKEGAEPRDHVATLRDVFNAACAEAMASHIKEITDGVLPSPEVAEACLVFLNMYLSTLTDEGLKEWVYNSYFHLKNP